jgi:hypothetical protein
MSFATLLRPLSRRSHQDKSLLARICSVGYRDGLLIRHELLKSSAARLIPDDHQDASAISSSGSSALVAPSLASRGARLSVHRDKALTDFSETGIRAPSIRAPTGRPLDWGTMAFPTVLTIVRLGQWRPPAPRG